MALYPIAFQRATATLTGLFFDSLFRFHYGLSRTFIQKRIMSAGKCRTNGPKKREGRKGYLMTVIKIMPCLDMKNGRVVKGIHFVDLKDAGASILLAASVFHYRILSIRQVLYKMKKFPSFRLTFIHSSLIMESHIP
jgi:hypothetical protein